LTTQSLASRALGRTGRSVSVLGLGGAGCLMNQYGPVTDAEAIAVVDRAVELGVTYVDTAPAYGDRLSERRVGLALERHPDVVVATKTGLFDLGRGAYAVDFGASATRASIELSLGALRRERIDVVQLHELTRGAWAAAFARRGALAELTKARAEGLIGAIGVTGSDPGVLLDAIGTDAFDTVMVWKVWNLLDRAGESVLEAAAERGLGVVVGAPFASGILATGAVADATLHYAEAQPADRERVSALERTCATAAVPLARAALQFALDDRVSCVAAAAARPEHMDANVGHLCAPREDGLLRRLTAFRASA
jgi:D-threo-aldose 1-dehydrogenase